MKFKLLLLFSLFTVLAHAQNKNAQVYKFATLQDAVNRHMDLGTHISVSEPLYEGDFVEDTVTNTVVLDGGICIDKGRGHMLRRDISNADAIHFSWFGIKPINGTDTTDNYAKLNYLFSTAFPYHSFRWDKEGLYYCTQTLHPHKGITVRGPDSYEELTTTGIAYPKGTDAITFDDVNSAGSFLEGFTLQTPMTHYGRIFEYNPNNNTLLYTSPVTGISTNDTLEVHDAFTWAVRGTGVVTASGTNNIATSITYTQPTGTFVVGETVTGGSSGATATVRFVSRLYTTICVGTITGAFTLGETITGSSSGATGKWFTNNVGNWTFAKVATLSGVSGQLDSISTSNLKRQNVFILKGWSSNGVTANRRIYMHNMSLFSFGHDGVHVTSSTTPVGNANLVRLEEVRSNTNGGAGFYFEGGDANHGTVKDATAVDNGTFSEVDATFLGMTSNTVHSSANNLGGYGSTDYINRNSVAINPYSEGWINLPPWQQLENNFQGKLGGTDGIPNVVPDWSPSANSGWELSRLDLHNSRIYTKQNNNVQPQLVAKGNNPIAIPFAVEEAGNFSPGRGAGYGFYIPYGSGWQGPYIKNTARDMGFILGTASSSLYEYQFWMRRNLEPVITVTGTGTGANLQPEILNGSVVSVNVLSGGKEYATLGTTATLAAPAGGTAATFWPIVQDGVITNCIVLTPGSGYNDNDKYNVMKMNSAGELFPTTDTAGNLGDATHRWNYLYVHHIITDDTTIKGSASSNPILNQGASIQAGGFYVGQAGTLGSILSNTSLTPTLIGALTNAGLQVVSRAADTYQTAFHLYQSGATSGMHLSAPGSNMAIMSTGGFYNKSATGIKGSYMPLETNVTALALNSGKVYMMNNTATTIGTLATLNYIAIFDEKGVSYNGSNPTAGINLKANSTTLPSIQFDLAGAVAKTTAVRGALEALPFYLLYTDSSAVRDTVATRGWLRGNSSLNPVLNQSASLQLASFYIGSSNPTIITNHPTIAVTTISSLINSGLNVINRQADTYWSALNVYSSGNASGMHFSSPQTNTGIVSAGGIYYRLASGITGSYLPLETSMTALAQQTGKFYFLNGIGLTAGTVATLNKIGVIDENGASFTANNPTARLNLKANSTTFPSMQFDLAGAVAKTSPLRGAMEIVPYYIMFTDSSATRDTLATMRWARTNISGGTGGGGITTESDPIYQANGVTLNTAQSITGVKTFPSSTASNPSLIVNSSGTNYTGTTAGAVWQFNNHIFAYLGGSVMQLDNTAAGVETDPVYSASGVTTNTVQTLTSYKTFPASTGSTPSIVLGNSLTNYTGTTAGALWTYNNHLYAYLNGQATQIDNQPTGGGGGGGGSADTICNSIYNDVILQTAANFNIDGTGKMGALAFNTTVASGSSSDSILTVNTSNGAVRAINLSTNEPWVKGPISGFAASKNITQQRNMADSIFMGGTASSAFAKTNIIGNTSINGSLAIGSGAIQATYPLTVYNKTNFGLTSAATTTQSVVLMNPFLNGTSGQVMTMLEVAPLQSSVGTANTFSGTVQSLYNHPQVTGSGVADYYVFKGAIDPVVNATVTGFANNAYIYYAGKQTIKSGVKLYEYYADSASTLNPTVYGFYQKGYNALNNFDGSSAFGSNVSIGGNLSLVPAAIALGGTISLLVHDGTDNVVKRLSTGVFLSAQHPASTGSAPFIASNGTNVSASINSTGKDAAFKLTLVVSGNATGTLCNVTYNTAWTFAPEAVATPGDFASSGLVIALTATTGGIQVTGVLPPGTYTFNIISMQ